MTGELLKGTSLTWPPVPRLLTSTPTASPSPPPPRRPSDLPAVGPASDQGRHHSHQPTVVGAEGLRQWSCQRTRRGTGGASPPTGRCRKTCSQSLRLRKQRQGVVMLGRLPRMMTSATLPMLSLFRRRQHSSHHSSRPTARQARARKLLACSNTRSVEIRLHRLSSVPTQPRCQPGQPPHFRLGRPRQRLSLWRCPPCSPVPQLDTAPPQSAAPAQCSLPQPQTMLMMGLQTSARLQRRSQLLAATVAQQHYRLWTCSGIARRHISRPQRLCRLQHRNSHPMTHRRELSAHPCPSCRQRHRSPQQRQPGSICPAWRRRQPARMPLGTDEGSRGAVEHARAACIS